MTDNKLVTLDRREIPPAAKALFLSDFTRLAQEYFEFDGKPDVDVTRTDDGVSVCIILSARRVKKVNAIVFNI